ncbi:GNAT family N-acetyltransferase [Enterobacter hormaechei]|uniref:GNAT family N-acetyltransferase n=1 Tax=Enterobacter hormaechei TaxID=158836 RepID=UPI00079AF9A4|nr:GNAT family N-acetyltransferase [Enterobacter hormaechei]MCU3014503.1 GNAT family N-acetyltransferase [Enterobacter hormaechei subsp. oharae]HDT3782534.1 GNAT family N-acetyltransferase [Enterobacter hormaechei subsp. steigerwaltii]MCU3612567.1 GNAT family N-acetyltransferase [Enterobacter hormaechei subsp. oharae]MDK3077231.1 GNAT family N-acetyltransferase [Enterobacter hormaechei]CZU36142.1 N-acetyltransferase GCN5 [Enterobacter hormaechei]
MMLRKARPEEAETLWHVRNEAIRHGCKICYDAEVIARWTPEKMPEHYRLMVRENPFYVVEDDAGDIAATGYLDLETHSIEAMFTLPASNGKGMATRIIETLKNEARSRGIPRLVLSATPNASTFYQKVGFAMLGENTHYSRMADAHLRCIEMAIDL